jgi:hypothetical protein
MSKLHFYFKGTKRNTWGHIIDFKLFVPQKHAPFYENTCSLYELDEKPNIQKFQSLEILKERATKKMNHFLNHLTKTLCSMGSECLTLGGCHMCRK